MADALIKYQLTPVEKAEIVGQVVDAIQDGNVHSLTVNISEADKADIIAEVLATLKAESIQTSTLEVVSTLEGLTSIPAVRNDEDIVAVPLNLLTTSEPIEIPNEEQIAILVAQGRIIPKQLYFTAEEDEE